MPIRKLSVQLANQIAAGEVVERPASVVKELLENAIDAHATSITLELKLSGKQLIKVTDNGSGIPKDELVLALAPHATSKISCLEDLAAITTMGFRGEALASIASVSRLTLISNTKGQMHGYQVEVSGPEQNPQVAPAAHPIGTCVVVRELFFNTPARRRFLKSDKTELSHIKDLVTRLALVNYGIEFTLINDGRTILQIPAQTKAQLPQRIKKLLGSDFNYQAISFDNTDPSFVAAWQQAQQGSYHSEHDYYAKLTGDTTSPEEVSDPLSSGLLQMHGLIVKPPSLLRALPDRIMTFLNGRIIADKMVNRALREAYLSVVQDDPSFKPCLRAIIFMHCDPHIVDVNVHPRKDEVRFHESNLIYDAIVTNVRAALLTHNLDAQSATRGSLDLNFAEVTAPKEEAKSVNPQASEKSDTAAAEAVATENAEVKSPISTLTQERWGALWAKVQHKSATSSQAQEQDSAKLRLAVSTYLEGTAHHAVAPAPDAVSSDEERLEGAMVDVGELVTGKALEAVLAQARQVTQNMALAKPKPEEALTAAGQEIDMAAPALPQMPRAASDEVELNLSLESEDEEDDKPRSLLAERLRLSRSIRPEHNSSIYLERSQPQAALESVVHKTQEAPSSFAAASADSELDLEFQGRAEVAPSRPRTFSASEFLAQSAAKEQVNAEPRAEVAAPTPKPQAEPQPQPQAENVTTAASYESAAKAQFLALVAPNVVLFSHAQRYFMAQGSALFAHFLAQVYRKGVIADTVERCELTLPFALRLESSLLKAFKRTELMSAAARAGFVVKSQLTRSAIELLAIPKMVSGTNLAQVAGQALQIIATDYDLINRQGQVPELLVKCISQAKRYELNTVLDAKAMVEHLQPEELTIMLSEAQKAQGSMEPKTRLSLSLSRQGFAICELDLCSLAYQMLGGKHH